MHVKRRVIGAILLGAALGPAQALQYWPAQEQDDAPPSYDAHGHALAVDEQGLVYVDRQDRPVLRPFIYDNGPDFFQDGLARHVENGKMGFHDEALKVVIPARYDFAFRSGTAGPRWGWTAFSTRSGNTPACSASPGST